MQDLGKTYIFRMTHIENIPHILEHGITHISSPQRNSNYVSIGDSSIISSRNNHALHNGKGLGEYIPFYFGVRMPMLFVIQKGFNNVNVTPAEKIVYCISSVKRIVDLKINFIFTDGHAVDNLSTYYNPQDVDDIDNIIDFKAVRSKYWKDDKDLDLKRRKEAEFLIADDIPISAILGYVVYNQVAKQSLLKLGVKDGNVHLNPEFYF